MASNYHSLMIPEESTKFTQTSTPDFSPFLKQIIPYLLSALKSCNCYKTHDVFFCPIPFTNSATTTAQDSQHPYFVFRITSRDEGSDFGSSWHEVRLGVEIYSARNATQFTSDEYPQARLPRHQQRSHFKKQQSPVNLRATLSSWPAPLSLQQNLAGSANPICQVLSKARSDQYLESSKENYSPGFQNLFQASAETPKGSAGPVSLASLLQGDHARKLKLKEKLILVVILANCILLFGDTPWLSKSWSNDHIFFFSASRK